MYITIHQKTCACKPSHVKATNIVIRFPDVTTKT